MRIALAFVLLVSLATLTAWQAVPFPGSVAPTGAAAPTITYVAAASGTNTTGSASCTVPVTFTSGQLAIAYISNAYGTTDVHTITLSVSDGTNTYTQFSTSPYTDASNYNREAYWWTQPATGAVTVTFTASSSAGNLQCIVVGYTSSSGWKASPIDKEATPAALGSGTLGLCPTTVTYSSNATATTVQDTELEIGMFALSTSAATGATWTAGAGFTQRQVSLDAEGFAELEDAVSISPGAFTATANFCTASSSIPLDSGAGLLVTLRPN